MHCPPVRMVSALLMGVLFIAQSALAADGISLTIEQQGSLAAPGAWTLTQPTQEHTERNDWSYTFPNRLPSGNYTLFVAPPKGTNATITLLQNNEVLTSVAHQLSFQATDGQELKILIENKLVNSGKVSVNSAPSGVPFVIKGPNNWSEDGVTPMSFENMPVGNYSVQYKPKGCHEPPAKSDLLIKNGRVDFFIEIQCSTFEAIEAPKEEHVATQVNGEDLTFVDVPLTEWFTPFVRTVVARGILTGYRDASGNPTGFFGPGNPVTLAELSKIAHEMAGINERTFSNSPENPMALWKWYTDYVVSAEQRGWLVYQDPALDLNRPATRGEVVVTLLQALDKPQQWSKGAMFTDVTARTPYAHAIETAATLGIVSGSTDELGKPTGLFHPQNPITRAEMARILVNAHELFLRRAAPAEY